MAKSRSKKAEERKARASRLTVQQFKSFLGSVGELRQDLDDAAMAHAAEFKKADSLGIHKAASALVMKLDKMEPAKRADFLRSFDQYRDWMEEWDAQPDLLEQNDEDDESAGDEAGEEDGAGEDGGYGDAGDPPPITEPTPRAEADAPVLVDADQGDTLNAPIVQLEDAGYIFATGKEAGLEGKQATDNPHRETDAAYAVWERGRALGAQHRDNPPVDDEPPAATNKGSRRRKKPEEKGAPLLH